jgi:precorrin-3B synthase
MTALAINRPQRRGACPSLSAPLQTGDGLLVRLLPTGTIPLAAFMHLCAASRQHGNGLIEITGRGSIQIRGLNGASASRFADAIAALDIAAVGGVPVLTNALAGLDAEEIFDASALAADLRRAVARTSLGLLLAPKVSVSVDGGGALSLDGIAADICLRAEHKDGDVALHIAVGGDGSNAAPLGAVAPTHAVEAAMRLLEVIADRGRAARARDILATEGREPFRAALSHLAVSRPLPPRNRNERTIEPIGRHKLCDGSLACGVCLPFGQANAAVLERLAQVAAAIGAAGMRAAPGQALMIVGLARDRISAFLSAAESLGFIVRADDPRRRVVACAGAPICSSAYIAARAIAPLVANAAAHLEGGFQVHISGCAKGCAHAGTASLTVVGQPDGCAVIANGTVRDVPFASVATDELPQAIARYARKKRREGGHV